MALHGCPGTTSGRGSIPAGPDPVSPGTQARAVLLFLLNDSPASHMMPQDVAVKLDYVNLIVLGAMQRIGRDTGYV